MYRPFYTMILVLPLCGCVEEEKTALVPPSPFGSPPPTPQRTQVSYAPASPETALRVDSLGRKIMTANPQIGLIPKFRTVGAPQPEIFHTGTSEIVITEGMVKQHPSDGELTALLCAEVAKMVAERESLARPETRKPPRRPPINVPIGNDGRGVYGAVDMTHEAEMAMYEEERGPRKSQAPPIDPIRLAHVYFCKTGYPAPEFERIFPPPPAPVPTNPPGVGTPAPTSPPVGSVAPNVGYVAPTNPPVGNVMPVNPPNPGYVGPTNPPGVGSAPPPRVELLRP